MPANVTCHARLLAASEVRARAPQTFHFVRGRALGIA